MDDKAQKRIAAECLTYAQRYRCSLHDAIAEWEAEPTLGSVGLTPTEKSEMAGYFHAMGMDLDVVRDVRDTVEITESNEPKVAP